ncbi:hypothetical protein KUTeg_022654 [Tegillarca granosa]|uniref:Peptidase M20 dimerisation domain-containing protein n=1 Tax=Tegillarca granosa TaxID=220873 RepID=A0ABQ9DZ84_TEGGR|nr:hypothetical protein KUTeg_022654 [Tegillarca granosa]
MTITPETSYSQKFSRLKMADNLKKLFDKIDENQEKYIQRLAETVAIKSVSAWPQTRLDIGKMVQWTAKFIFEGMEESGSEGLDDLVFARKDTFLKKKPCITYGLRHEAMVDLVAILNTLVDKDGKILIPGVCDKVAPLTEDEKKSYDPIDFDIEEYRKDTGTIKLIHSDKANTLMHRWRYPSLSIHGIEGAFSGTGAKTVIPRKVIGKFSIRLVPNQTPDEIEKHVKEHINKVVSMGHGGKPWVSDFNHPNFLAGRKAMKTEPDLTREGGSIPVTLTFQEATGKNVMLLPIGASDDGAHSQNEKIDRSNYINGIKVLGAYIDEIAKLKIDENQEKYIQRLAEAVAIKSVSAWPQTRLDIREMVQWTAKKLKELGATVELVDIGMQRLSDGTQLSLPNILLADLGKDEKKKTLLIYGHLDVQPAEKSDGWNSEPFVLQEVEGKLYGRGSTDDKFLLEGMEECGSEGLDNLVFARKDTFLKGVDYVCISDNYWLGKKKPCITYGLRGICYFFVEVQCATKDLHSGVFGGTVYEAMADLVAILNTLVDKDGKILIPGVCDKVAPLTEDEKKLYDPIDFDIEEYKNDIGAFKLIHSDKASTLMHRWRYPSLSIHGIEGAFSGPGSKTVIPRNVTGKFSIRLVPNQTPDEIETHVKKHINAVVSMGHGGKPWVSDFNHPNFLAGRKAMKTVFGVEPDLTREGGSIPVTLTFQKATGKNVMLLPIGASDDGAHSQNEKINRSNYINGIKVFGAYIDEIAKL